MNTKQETLALGESGVVTKVVAGFLPFGGVAIQYTEAGTGKWIKTVQKDQDHVTWTSRPDKNGRRSLRGFIF